jgi:hypothetical protein
MLAESDFLRKFGIVHRTDRDAEIPLLREFIERHGPYDSVLDVGSHGLMYAEEIRRCTITFHMCDVVVDHNVSGLAEYFYEGNFNELELNRYDLITCVSTLEHAGISTYRGDYRRERLKMFKKCLKLARKYLWISFPVGQPYFIPDQLAIIPETSFKTFHRLAGDVGEVTTRFLYTQGAQAGHPWIEHDRTNVALKIPYIDFIGNQSICVMEVVK